jgi:uncharacterized protein
MQYRTFGKLDWKPSALGFGAMRLPLAGKSSSDIDEAQATHMLRHAIDQGVNYVDTAYTYHGGNSEKFTGRALQDGYRERVKLVTKMPTWLVEKASDFDRYLDEQLQRLQTDHLDIYLLHTLDKEKWPKLQRLHVFDWAEKAMADGRIRHLGFSFHDDYDTFETIVDGYDNWTMSQIQYNYVDTEYQAGARGLKYAAGKGLAVVVMEPIRGGRLAQNIPATIQTIWDEAPVQRTPADWALQWVWNQPEVSLLLSGMSTFEQVEQNLDSANHSGPGTLSAAELVVIDRVSAQYQAWSPIPCTACGYCMPCPQGVNIPRILGMYNDAMMHQNPKAAAHSYSWLKEDERADQCIECGECLEMCPQQIEIPDWLAKAHALLSTDAA